MQAFKRLQLRTTNGQDMQVTLMLSEYACDSYKAHLSRLNLRNLKKNLAIKVVTKYLFLP